ncbi:UNVERIFIED_CONTAM: hypothetical protein FKN15_029235 [Acipenser sinensis]
MINWINDPKMQNQFKESKQEQLEQVQSTSGEESSVSSSVPFINGDALNKSLVSIGQSPVKWKVPVECCEAYGESDPRRGYLQPPPPLLWDHPCRQYRYDDDPAPRRVMQRPFPAQVKLARAPSLKDYPQSASQRGLPREVVSEELQSWHVRTVFRSVRPRSLDRQGAIRVRSNTPGRESPLTRQPEPRQQHFGYCFTLLDHVH